MGRATRLSLHALTPGLASCPEEKLTSSLLHVAPATAWVKFRPRTSKVVDEGWGPSPWGRQKRQVLIFPLQAAPPPPCPLLSACTSHFPSPRPGNWESAPPLSHFDIHFTGYVGGKGKETAEQRESVSTCEGLEAAKSVVGKRT